MRKWLPLFSWRTALSYATVIKSLRMVTRGCRYNRWSMMIRRRCFCARGCLPLVITRIYETSNALLPAHLARCSCSLRLCLHIFLYRTIMTADFTVEQFETYIQCRRLSRTVSHAILNESTIALVPLNERHMYITRIKAVHCMPPLSLRWKEQREDPNPYKIRYLDTLKKIDQFLKESFKKRIYFQKFWKYDLDKK